MCWARRATGIHPKTRSTKKKKNEDSPMNTKEQLINEIEGTPEPVLSEVLDFLHFLKAKTVRDKLDTATMSESSLGKDWLTPEEDEAWQSL
jgi:hypothetical protein